MPKRAFITGIAGQDGSYLTDLLLSKDYEVFGLVHGPQSDHSRLMHVRDKLQIFYGDVVDTLKMVKLLKEVKPTEVYNLAAKSFIPLSWSEPLITADVTAMGTTSMLEALRVSAPQARYFQAASSEIFGNALQSPQTETTSFNPRTPYGVSKLYSYFMTANYRDRYKLFCSSGIMYNHESVRRGHEFVTRKITLAVAQIALGLKDNLTLGNLDTRRDWGFAGDYVEAMWLMLQQDTPEDFVIATGVTHTVEELVALAFSSAGLDWHKYVVVDPALCRPTEKTILCGDSTKAQQKLKWQTKTSFSGLITEMVMHDITMLKDKLGSHQEQKAA